MEEAERDFEFFRDWFKHRRTYYTILTISVIAMYSISALTLLYSLLNPLPVYQDFSLDPVYIIVLVLGTGTVLMLAVLRFIIKNPPD